MAERDATIAGSGYGNVYIDALIAGKGGWDENSGPITWYLADASDVNAYGDPHALKYGVWTPTEIAVFQQVLENYSSVTKLTFQKAPNAIVADFVEWKVETGYNKRTNGTDSDGRHQYPMGDYNHYENPSQIWGFYEYERPSFAPMYRGGTGLYEIMHEIGHGLGLSHPFDTNERFPGVAKGDSNTTGSDGMSQAPFTIMGYNQGWDGETYPPFQYGRSATLGALDIAALQRIYGQNTSWHRQDDVYTLPTANAPGSFWACIWDTGGVDTIDNSASNISSTIDLRAATLIPGPNAGGYISHNDGIQGGLTIANGVVIENAKGGRQADLIDGNDVANVLSGGSGDDALSGRGGGDTLYGGSGHDSLVGSTGSDQYRLFDVSSGRYDTVFEKAGEGTDTVYIRLIAGSGLSSYALTDNVENGVVTSMSGQFTLTGNALNNRLTGDSGDDTLDGGIGADVMTGGKGNDTYRVDNFNDSVFESAGTSFGVDTVKTTMADYALAANVENLIYDGPSGSDFHGTGNELDNVIRGGGGNDKLFGVGGSDTMVGNAGNDTYTVIDAHDAIVESANGGQDYVNVSFLVNYTLPDNVEGMQSLDLGTKSFRGTGNALNNSILSYDGNDVLDGKGGADTMYGSGGNDTYYVDDAGDSVGESDGEGTDTVYASADYTLGDFQSIEFLRATAGATGLRLTGNDLANSIVGDSGADTLSGGSGGIDRLYGKDGDDTFLVDRTGVGVAENADEGNDTVIASIEYTLGANLEKLTLTGTTAVRGFGNTRDNTIVGNGAANILMGRDGADRLDGGSAGADKLYGGLGDDTYRIGHSGELVVEVAGEGNDSVLSAITVTLAANVENLTLTGSGAITGNGNELANVITGNARANHLTGGGGNDTFVFNTALSGSNVDRITDFSHAPDTIALENAIFKGVSGSALKTQFHDITSSAEQADDRILYNKTKGYLYYDSDGAGGHAPVHFATLNNHPTLNYHDFLVL